MDRQTVAVEVKKALAETVLLSDGRYGHVISEVHDPSGKDKWECHVCSRIITTERAMLMHLSHPLHMSKMRAPYHPPENFRKRPSRDEGTRRNLDPNKNKREENSWEAESIKPGEPIPPGMEDLLKKGCQLQETLDNHTDPLIGLEYIVELVSSEPVAEPKYICLLCEKKGDPRSVMVHLNSHNHSLRYISCFFRTAGNAINMIPKTRENRKGVSIAVQKITEEIQKHFGRLKPITAAAETFAQKKYEILRSIDESEHFRETKQTTFIEYCSAEKIMEYSRKAENELTLFRVQRPLEDNNATEQNQEIALERSNPIPKPIAKAPPPPIVPELPAGKLSFSIGKPERSFGRNSKTAESKSNEEKKDDDEVVFVESKDDPIEIFSMSSISSISDSEIKTRPRIRSRTPSRSRGRVRGRSPMRRRSPRRRSPASYRDTRYRSRSRSRSRGRYYREKYNRMERPREQRSRSKDRPRYNSRTRHSRERYRRSPTPPERERRRSPARSSRYGRSEERSPPQQHRNKNVKSPTPKKAKLSEYQQKMDFYRSKLHNLEVEMDNKLKYFKERPEKHPLYSEEWKNFWNRRYKELQQAGKDPNGYDFKPEWILFWDERVKKLHEDDLATRKDELKILIPEEDKVPPSSGLQDISPPTPELAKDITVGDIKNTWKALTGSEIKAPSKNRSPTPDRRSSKRSPSPWEEKKNSKKGGATYVADPPIVHSLRMLSVLEQQLGSLGPKALNLLSRAIIMEKVKHNESMLLLQDPDIHIFFETVKEKIRGQLIAGIVVRYLVNSCRSLITTIENMLADNPPKSNTLASAKTNFPTTIHTPEPVKVEGVGLVNKMAVAQQIAETLVAQGRTDVTQQELEELINAVVGIASNSNLNINQPSASFMSQLNVKQLTSNSHINNLLNSLIISAQKSVTPVVVPEKSSEPTPEIVSQVVGLSTILESPPISLQKSSLFPIDKQPSVEKEVLKDDKKISDQELKERLVKFKLLSRDEQQNLIILLKELEGKEPERVEKLRKYVTVGLSNNPLSKSESENGRLSPFSSRSAGTNPAPEERKKILGSDNEDDDDDDYTVEDIYKSVSEKLKKKANDRKPEFKINPEELFDENNDTSSHQGFGRALSPSHNFPSQPTMDKDNRIPYQTSSQPPPKSDYNVYPVGNVPSESYKNASDPFKQATTPMDTSYKTPEWQNNRWDGPHPHPMDRDNRAPWTGNKNWPQDQQGMVYPQPVQPTYQQGQFNVNTYPQTQPAKAPQYYGGETNPYTAVPPSNDQQYPPPQYNNLPPYQAPMYNNNMQGVHSGNPYNYQKPPGQGGYYGNFRQY